MKPAVFLDRDGTLIEHVHYLADPADVRLVDGAAEALNRLRRAGYTVVVVTNQSAVGRGILTEETLDRIHRVMTDLLAERGASIDGLYHCAAVPTVADQTIVEHPDRKPGPGMLRRAAGELGLDLSRSWMVGDSLSDIMAGRNAGCRGCILVRTGYGAETERHHAPAGRVADDLPAAAEMILEADRPGRCPSAAQPEETRP